eukprot:TRINITY_DN27228_c0_g1_i1.p1 TRINITY_DN27228_c0_g1~~TRINITY_DN27228_c0_g1_i1.p1  ORF type:complete len:448 (-),score=71.62 TRINITY_DN27228_c0_g1_i1:555-1898(-)
MGCIIGHSSQRGTRDLNCSAEVEIPDCWSPKALAAANKCLPGRTERQRRFRQNLLEQTDPRRIISLFFGPGDTRGPLGSVCLDDFDDPADNPDDAAKTRWFAVFRPCSVDSITKMRSSKSTGKGLNVKGKSAKKGHLSGLVPFLQISKNEHVKQVCTPPHDSRIHVYYSNEETRAGAFIVLQRACDTLKHEYAQAVSQKRRWDEDPSSFSNEEEADMFRDLNKRMEDPKILEINMFHPDFFGLDVPELALREAYLVQQDITPLPGWETGRESEPAFQDMNLLALRVASSPKPVLIQHDKDRPLNPWGLVMAYSEEQVLPVVSDFDPFLFGSVGMTFASITKEHEELMLWCLARAREVLQEGSTSWTSAWLQILKREGDKGFHPEIPKYGFGDDTSCAIVEHLVASTSFCGAVRHGAECFNWYFPQELDDEFLVIWEGFDDATGKVLA